MSNIIRSRANELKEKQIKLKPVQINDANNHSGQSLEAENLQAVKDELDKAYKELDCVKAEQTSVLENTYAKIKDAKEKWKTERQAYVSQAQQEGFTKGYEDGKENGLAYYQEQIDEANKLIAIANEEHQEIIEQSEPAILELAVQAAKKIIDRELREHPDTFISIVKAAIQEMKDQTKITIYVHPGNYELLLYQQEELKRLADKTFQVFIYMDNTLSADSCLIEHPFGQIDASIDTQLKELRQHLLEINKEASK